MDGDSESLKRNWPEGGPGASFELAREGSPDISPSVSVIWKPLHRLFQYDDGNPIDPITVLFYDIDGRHLPFASITKTRGNRLILWPPFDACEPGNFRDGRSFAIHHVTLELSNGKTHLTRFAADGQRIHDSPEWYLVSFPDSLKFWLVTACKVTNLDKQVGALEQSIRMPKSDSNRREQEFRRYTEQIQCVVVNSPAPRGDFLVTVFHILPDTGPYSQIQPGHFPMGQFWNEWVDGWPDGDSFQIAQTGVIVGGLNLILLTAAPVGSLKASCFLGGAG